MIPGDDTALLQEGADRIAFLAKFLGGIADQPRHGQPALQVIQQPVAQPVQNAAAFVPEQVFAQVLVAPPFRDLHIPRHQQQPPPDTVIRAPHHRLVVAADRQLEIGVHLDEIAVQGAHHDWLAPRQFLDQLFLQRLALARFRCPHKPRPDQQHQVGRGIAAAAPVHPGQRLDLGRGRIVVQHPRHQIGQHRFAVRPGPVPEGQHLHRRGGHRQAQPAHNEGPHLRVRLHLFEKRVKARAGGSGVIDHRHHLGHQLRPVMRQQLHIRRPAEPLIRPARYRKPQHPGFGVDIHFRRIQAVQIMRQRDPAFGQQRVDLAGVAGAFGKAAMVGPLRPQPLFKLANGRHLAAQIGHLRLGFRIIPCGLDRLDLVGQVTLARDLGHHPVFQHQEFRFGFHPARNLLRQPPRGDPIRVFLPDLAGPGEPAQARHPHHLIAEIGHKPLAIAEIIQRKA